MYWSSLFVYLKDLRFIPPQSQLINKVLDFYGGFMFINISFDHKISYEFSSEMVKYENFHIIGFSLDTPEQYKF